MPKTAIGFQSAYGGGFAAGAPDRSAVVVQEGRVGTEGTSERAGLASQQKKSMQATGMKSAKKATALTKSVAATDDAKSVTGGGAGYNIESIHIATYVCDFGNVVVGRTAKKQFLLTNVGKLPVSFNFDKSKLTEAGISIDPEKVPKIAPNSSQRFDVQYTTRKTTTKFGPTTHTINVDVKGGPQYKIQFIANLTIPELSISDAELDFGKVCVGTRKTVKIRLENLKEVPCDWWYYYKPDVSAPRDAGERFTVSPQSKLLQPGQRQTVDIMFFPTSDKPFSQKLTFKCKENSRPFPVNVRGQGAYYQVECTPDKVKLGPVLPYQSVEAPIELYNPMDQAIEVYSLDFDKQYLGEEEVLKRHDNFAGLVSGGPPAEPLYLPLREPGSEFWPHLKLQDEKKRHIDGLRKELADIEEQVQQHEALEGKPVLDENGDAKPEEEASAEWAARKQQLEE